ncbi:NhaP-type Na+/H+ or K+/H+ antiporter [Thermocatellispora tengchongensis]|uniref:NhaP-type Na+/H+ or K+/H+ antiporter n=1 Tax=Thermocatellispora tengchongensis TaxID=1073253 RepID=A0A840P0E3_9ACTN|nr:hypothetical protein [Thermocatellispora tengchongensis]MBB5131926.1 NhaP-type Na+/H+ or K+/H+ antiporter [Thermocatellispora tengchongensis]
MAGASASRGNGGRAARRLLLATGVAAAGFAVASLAGLTPSAGSPAFMYAVSGLLAVGLYAGAYGISREVVRDLRTVVLAVTVGVVLKTALIALVMYLCYRDPASLLFAVAVAQIDPLSVAALIGGSGMSARARNLLLAWASFDDPVTALLTVYLSAWMLRDSGTGGGLAAYLMTAWGNAVLAAVAAVVWFGGRWLRDRIAWRPARDERLVRAVAIVALVAALAVAVRELLLLGAALMGLFFRPWLDRWLDRITALAFLLATFATGMLLVQGVNPVKGLVLGLAAFLAQAVVGGFVIARGLSGEERVYLALGQQNGITAILLALALAGDFPEAVAVIAPAVFAVNVVHLVANTLWERLDPYGRRRLAVRLRMAPAAERAAE